MNFLEKYELVKKSVPVPAVVAINTFGCEFGNLNWSCKNCYYVFESYYLEDSLYTEFGAYSKTLVDCFKMLESEKCYESSDCSKCYNSSFLIYCNSCTDCHFSTYLNSCSNCFGCVALTHKKYCIFNKQYTKEEYFKKLEKLKTEDPQKIFAQMLELKKTVPHPASTQSNAINSPYGDNIYNSKNCFWAFYVFSLENSGYAFSASFAKKCWDVAHFGGDPKLQAISELCYENLFTETCYNCTFLYFSGNCTNCYYGADLKNCTDCFGCVGLTNKKYCILNNQLTKDQYEKAVKDIRKELGWQY